MSIRKKFDLSKKVALVTGGAGLLGEQFCHTLTQAGASVVIADLNIVRAEKLALELIDNSGKAVAFETDITSKLSVENMVSRTIKKFGRLDILVNSAAIDPKFDRDALSGGSDSKSAFEDFSLDSWQHALDVNLTGMFLCCQAVVGQMLKQGSGVIINLSSIYAIGGPDQRIYQTGEESGQYKPVYYSVTKAGVIGLTKYLAAYYRGKNLRVNALTPGGVYNRHEKSFVEAYSDRTIIGRMAEIDEMNGALLFLASDASSYMTGTNLVIDGGWTAW
jgi:2-deoxy-D-gluconate 3-dehydrogenase